MSSEGELERLSMERIDKKNRWKDGLEEIGIRVHETPIRVCLGGLYPSRGRAKGLVRFGRWLRPDREMASQAGPFRPGLPLPEAQDSPG